MLIAGFNDFLLPGCHVEYLDAAASFCGSWSVRVRTGVGVLGVVGDGLKR